LTRDAATVRPKTKSAPAPANTSGRRWRNCRYGTIVCDLERRQVVTLLPDREVATVQAWLAAHPSIKVISRDRGGGYGEAAAKALPGAMQVADRWHLMENASSAFLDAVRKSMRAIRGAIGATTIDPALLTSAEKLQYESYLRREETNAAIIALAKDGASIKQIVRRIGHSRNLVRQVLRGQRTDVFQRRQSSIDGYLPFLDEQWTSGCRKGAELWRRLREKGFRGSLRVVSEWATRRRRAQMASKQQLQKVPSVRAIARLMTVKRDPRNKADAVTLAAIQAGVPSLVQALTLVERFHAMIGKKEDGDIDPWIAEARGSLLSSFAAGIRSPRRHHTALVKRPGRSANHQTQARQTPDVRAREPRPSSGQAARRA
jgi:transposase